MTYMNFMDEPMSDEERLVMQETMHKKDIEALQSALTTAQEEITASRNFIEDILGHATKSQLRAIAPFHEKYRAAMRTEGNIS